MAESTLRLRSLLSPRRRLWAAGLIAAVLAVVTAGLWLPGAGLRWGVVEGLRRMGMAEVSLADADLSLFRGAVVIKSVVARASQTEARPFDLAGLILDFRWKPLLSRRVSVEALELDGVNIDVRRDGQAWVINGLPMVVSAAAGGPAWSFDADRLRLTNSRLSFSDGGLAATVELDELAVDDLRSWDPRVPLAFRLKGRLNGAPISLEGTATPFAGEPAFTATVKTDGLDLAGLGPLAAGMHRLAGTINSDLAITGRVESKGIPVDVKGEVRGTGLEAATAGVAVALADAGWRGTLRLGSDGAARAEGRIELGVGSVQIGATRTEQRRAAAEGVLTLKDGDVAGSLDGWIEGVAARQPSRDLAAADRLDFKGLALSPDEGVVISHLDARGVGALAKPGRDGHPWRIELRQGSADRLAFGPDGGVTATEIALAGATARLVRTEDGFVGFEGGDADEERPRLAVGRLRLSGGRVEFEDRTASDPVRLALDRIEAGARGMDSWQPNRDTPFTIKARIGDGRVDASGSVRPFAELPTGRVKGTVKALELPPLSPYVADLLGVRLHTGHFDGELAMAVDKGALDGTIELTLSNLFMDPPDPDAPLVAKVDMPIGTVLDLLRDSDDRIRLTVPVRGDLANPDFDVSDAVAQAVGGALKSTVFTTLKVAFPVVALLSYAIDESANPRLSLEPLSFAPGDAVLDAARHRTLAAVAELMRRRPAIKLTLCGSASIPTDWPVLLERRRIEELGLLAKLQKMVGAAAKPEDTTPDRDALASLADRRSQAVKGWLVDEAGIDAGRLFTCRPKVEEQPKAGPRVDLVL